MKKPEETIKTRTDIFGTPSCSSLNLAPLAEWMASHPHVPLSDIWVFCTDRDWDEAEYIKIVAFETRPNPNYEKELQAYEAHLAAQRRDKINWKLKALADLESRMNVIRNEIKELENEKT